MTLSRTASPLYLDQPTAIGTALPLYPMCYLRPLLIGVVWQTSEYCPIGGSYKSLDAQNTVAKLSPTTKLCLTMLCQLCG